MADNEIRFRIVTDASTVPPAAAATEAGLERVNKAGNAAAQQLAQVGKQSGAASQGMRMMIPQLSQTVSGLATGQPVWTVFLQQGHQVLDIASTMRIGWSDLASVFSVSRVAIGGVVGSLGLLAFGAYQGRQEANKLAQDIARTGNAAALNGGQFTSMARQVAAATDSTIGSARQALAAVVETGDFTSGSAAIAARAVLAMQRVTDVSAQDAAKDFAGMANDVTGWAAAHQRAYHFLSVDQFEHIQRLEAEGRTQEAMRIAMEAYAATIESRTVPAMGALENSLRWMKENGSAAWDWVKGIGRPEDTETQIASLEKTITKLQNTHKYYGLGSPKLTEEQAQIDALRNLAGRDAARRVDAAIAQQQVDQQIEEQSRGHQDALLRIESAGAALALARRLSADESRQLAARRSFDQDEITAQDYSARLIAVERDRLAAQAAQLDQAASIEKRRKVTKPDEVLAQQAALLDIDTRRVAVQQRQAELADKIARGDLAVAPKSRQAQGDDFRAMEHAQAAGVEQYLSSQRLAAESAAHELIDTNRRAAVELIQDDQQRGMAEIALDEELMRRRLDIASLDADQRQAVEERLATWRLQREQKLANDLKPQYQKDAEVWQDAQQFKTRGAQDFMNGFIQTGEQAFTQWVHGGKGAADTLRTYIENQLAKIAYQRLLEPAMASIGNLLFSGVTSLFGLAHEGAVIGQGGSARSVSPLVFAGAPRLHSGGLVGDEVPIIALKGEEMLSRSDPRNVRNGGKTARGGTQIVQVGGGDTYNFGAGVNAGQLQRYVEANNRRQTATWRRLQSERS